MRSLLSLPILKEYSGNLDKENLIFDIKKKSYVPYKTFTKEYRLNHLDIKNNVRDFAFKVNENHNSLQDVQRRFGIYNFKNDLNDESLDKIIKYFLDYSRKSLYGMFFDEKTRITHFRQLAKRGNKKYINTLKAKLLKFFSFLDKESFERNFMLRKTRQGLKTNVLFLTLTTNPKRFKNNKKMAWALHSKELNLFLTKMRKKYKEIEYVSVLESTKKGFPHNHIILFTKKPFNVKLHRNKENEYTYRLTNNKFIKNSWKAFSDIKVPESIQQTTNYIFKDMFKATTKNVKNRSRQENLTLALGWLFRKRSYTLSRWSNKGFLSKYVCTEFIKISVTQTALLNDINSFKNGRFVFLGITSLIFDKGFEAPPDFKLKLNSCEIEKICLVTIAKKLYL